jgi:hypothetical protein
MFPSFELAANPPQYALHDSIPRDVEQVAVCRESDAEPRAVDAGNPHFLAREAAVGSQHLLEAMPVEAADSRVGADPEIPRGILQHAC